MGTCVQLHNLRFCFLFARAHLADTTALALACYALLLSPHSTTNTILHTLFCALKRCVQDGTRRMGAPIACIGSGTGLGECYLTAPRGSEVYDAFPTGMYFY
jgi:hypothetical protein